QIVFQTEEVPPAPSVSTAAGWHVLAGAAFLESVCAAGGNPVPTPSAVVRTQLLKELGGYREELPHTADMEMWMRIAVHASVGIRDADQAYKRSHGQNMQVEYITTALGDLRQRQAAFDILFRNWGHRIPRGDRLEKLANHKVAEAAFWAGSRAFDQGNAVRCRDLLEYALALDPDLRSRPQWSRLRWKRRLGPKLWSWLRPLVEQARRRPLPTADRSCHAP